MEAIRRAPTLLALLVVATIVVGCGRQTSTAAAQAPAATTITTPAPTPSPTVDPTLDPASLARCGVSQAEQSTMTQAKDMVIGKPTLPLGYPAVQLSDQTPLKPLQVPVQVSNNALRSGQFPGATPANPGALTGSTRSVAFVASICNGSASATHVVQSVSVNIASLTPYSGQLTVWSGCDTAFSRQNPNVHTGGCGGGTQTDEQMAATFPLGARQGTTVVATQTGFTNTPNNASNGPLPVSLAPGKTLSFWVVVSVPNMAGTYAFGISFQVDHPPAVGGYSADPFLAAPVAHTFTGAACNTPAMLAQIPAATTPETYYICPQ